MKKTEVVAESGDKVWFPFVGATVEAYYNAEDEEDSGWFVAKILLKNSNGLYNVDFIEFDEPACDIEEKFIRQKKQQLVVNKKDPAKEVNVSSSAIIDIGSNVEAFFDDGETQEWYPAQILEKKSDGTFLVDFVEFDEEAAVLGAHEVRLLENKQVEKMGDDPKVGAPQMEAFYADGDEQGWFDVQVIRKNPNGTYHVNFIEFDEETADVGTEHLRVKQSIEVGCEVVAFFDDPDEGGWFPAKVIAKNSNGSFRIDFTQFEDSECDLEREHIRPLEL